MSITENLGVESSMHFSVINKHENDNVIASKISSVPINSREASTTWIPGVDIQPNLVLLYFTWSMAILVIVLYLLSVAQQIFAQIMSVGRLYRFAKMPPDIVEWPAISIVKPLLGVDSQLHDNLETFFKMDYAGKYEMLFCVEDPRDSSLSVVHALMAKYPHVEVRIFDKGAMCSPSMTSGKPGDAPAIINPMVRNMNQGYENAKYEYIWISSSRCRTDGDMMRDMVSRATDPTVGLVHQMPYIWVPPHGQDYAAVVGNGSNVSRFCPSGSSSFGTILERMYFSTSLARPYLGLNLIGVVCFTGMSYVFRKAVMEKAGGLRSFGNYLAEDWQLSHKIASLGYRPVLAAVPAMQNNGPNLPFATLRDRLVRWHRLRLMAQPFVTLCLEPFQDCFIIGILASWAFHYMLSIDPIYFFHAHLILSFCFDALLFCSGHRFLSARGACCCCCGPARINPLLFVISWITTQILPIYIMVVSFCNAREIIWGKHTYRLSYGAAAKIVR